MPTRKDSVRFKEEYKIRSGIEATNSELKRGHGLRKLRVRRFDRVALAVRFKILAVNIKRYVTHLTNSLSQASPARETCAC